MALMQKQTIVLRREVKVGEAVLAPGAKIAEVSFEPGVHLNWLTSALASGIAGPDAAEEAAFLNRDKGQGTRDEGEGAGDDGQGDGVVN